MTRRRTPGRKWAVLGWIVVPLALAGVFLARDQETLERGNRLFRAGEATEAAEVYRSLLGSAYPVSGAGGDVGSGAEGPRTTGSEPSNTGPGVSERSDPSDSPDPSALVELYNLGTAALRAGAEPEGGGSIRRSPETGTSDTAPGMLAAPVTAAVSYLEGALARGEALESKDALGTRDSTALQRAHYNLGAHHLGRLEPSMRLDSAFLFASAAVTHNREALLRDSDDENARWNLALAQRSLDSLLVELAIVDDRDAEEVEALDGIEFDAGMLTRAESSEPDALPPPEGTRPDPEERQTDDQARAQAAIEGAREALEGRDPGLIDRARALETLQGFRDDPERVVRGILWVQRPDVVWWDQTPYPGGDW
ncbi:MAG: hypothetical protein ACOC8K_09220 [Gemmatimonadota bacterium]